MNSNQIDILLATYNGERYLSEQLDSILKQSCDNWRIFVRDDGSEDGTSTIIERYQKQYSGKIFIIKDEKQNLGACGNFSELLKKSKSDYIMFCDQDDVWKEDKIKITLKKMKQVAYMPASQLSSSIILRMIEAPFSGCPNRDKARAAAIRTVGFGSAVASITAMLASAFFRLPNHVAAQ